MLNNTAKISVIIPAFNIADYLPRCLESVMNQTYKNLEIIVISDGSTDGTNDIIKEYAEKDTRIVPVFKENSGVSDTRNKGLDIATGDYIGFVDGDDYIEPDMYEVLLKNALEHDADISHCGYQMVFPSRVDYYYNTKKKVIQDNKKGLIDLITGEFIEPGLWNKLYKKDILNGLRMPSDIKINEDVLFNFYVFTKSEKSVYEDIPFYHYILRKGSAATSKVNENKLYDPIKVRKEIFEYCEKNYDLSLQANAYASYLSAMIILYRGIYGNKLKDQKATANKYKSDFKKINVKFKLSKRSKIERILFLYFTSLHMFVYKVYDKFISKNTEKYEVK